MDSVVTFIQDNFTALAFDGFAAGLILSASIMAIRAVVHIFVKIVKS